MDAFDAVEVGLWLVRDIRKQSGIKCTSFASQPNAQRMSARIIKEVRPLVSVPVPVPGHLRDPIRLEGCFCAEWRVETKRT